MSPAASESILRRLVSPHSSADFVNALDLRKPLVCRHDGRDLTDIFSLNSLGEVLDGAPLPHEQVLLISGGRHVSPIDGADYITRMKAGATLVLLEGQQWSATLRDLCGRLAFRLGCSVRANVYYSQPGHRGYLAHYDTHDVLILQISGAKRWRISERTTEDPLFFQKQHDRSAPSVFLTDELLLAGDVLYLPRGYWHETIAEGEQSLHLTLGLRPPTGIDFATWMVNELRERRLWRHHLQTYTDSDTANHPMPDGFGTQCSDLLTDLRAWTTEQDLAPRYWEYLVAADRDQSPFRLTSIFGDRQLLPTDIIQRPETQRCVMSAREDGTLQVVVWGQEFSFSQRCANVVRRIFDGTMIELGELLDGATISFDEVAQIALRLAREGIIEVVSTTPRN